MRVIGNDYYPYELMSKQIICDTLKDDVGHYDPRVAVKLATTSDPNFEYIDNPDSVKAHKYYGSSFTSASGPIGTAPSFYGRNEASRYSGNIHDGIGDGFIGMMPLHINDLCRN